MMFIKGCYDETFIQNRYRYALKIALYTIDILVIFCYNKHKETVDVWKRRLSLLD